MNYLEESEKTENKDYEAIAERINAGSIQLLHASIGIGGESGEFLDTVKKHVFYGSALNKVNIREELGDLMWYIALACRAIGVTIEDICEDNIKKLSKRYPEKFSKECAENRNVDNELSHF